MDYTFNKNKANKPGRAPIKSAGIKEPIGDFSYEPVLEQSPEFNGDGEVASWDFQQDPSGASRFSYSKRPPAPAAYRLLGQNITPKPVFGANAAAAPATRPNRYNASVKMVDRNDEPAPWDRESVHYLKMPVVGEVAAGRYDVTVAYQEPGFGTEADFVMVNPAQVKIGRNNFALRVRGSSMIDNEIADGDIIIVQAQDWADEGDFVIACLADSSDPAGFVTLKRFYRHRQSDRVVLQPANANLSPIHILPRKGDSRDDLDGVKIQGRVTAIIKSGSLEY